MTRTFKTEAIIFKKKTLLNKDMLVTMFTEEHGKIKVFAKGIKKITSRRLSHIQTGNLIQLIVSDLNGRYYLQETSLISIFSALKKNKIKMEAFYFILFILDRLLPENFNERSIYKILKKFIIKLSNEKSKEEVILTEYLNIILKRLGYSIKDFTLQEIKSFTEEIINEKLPPFESFV